VVLYIETDDFDQALSVSNSLIEPTSDSTVVDQYRTSDRGDYRASATLWPIGRKCASADSPPVPPPAISTNAYADDGQSPDFEASAAVPAHVVGHAIAAKRRGKAIIKVMRKAFRTRERNPPRRAPSLPAAPLKRAARARAVHSHTSHGGARKAGDDGDGGDGEPPSGTQSDYDIWASGEAYAVAKRCRLLDPIPKLRPGYVFVNANGECWRRQFSNLFCTKRAPVDRREVRGGGQ
jgi:hypothetical protein